MNDAFPSRAAQAASLIRERIRAGNWHKKLPAQRALARQLGISRRSLGPALAELEREGLLLNRLQAGTFIVRKRPIKARGDISVGIVLASNHPRLDYKQIAYLYEMRRIFDSRKIRTELHQLSVPATNRVPLRFKKLIRETAHHCWILVSPTAGMESWCQQHQTPAVVLGAGNETGGLPGVGRDVYALCRHAAGEMLRRGHRNLALILPKGEKGEDIQSRLGFEDGIRHSPHSDARFTFEYHDMTLQGVCQLADRMLERADRPTAWLVCRQGHFLTIMTHLLDRQIRVPEHISLINRDSESLMGEIVPEPTRYVLELDALAQKCAHLALKIISGHSLPGERLRLMPVFHPGRTLGPGPS